MAPDPDQHHEDPEETLRALGPLFRPLSDAELAKRRRMHEEAGYLNPVDVKFMIIMMGGGFA